VTCPGLTAGATDHRGNALSVGNRRTQALVVYLALRITGKTSLREIAELLFESSDAIADVRALVRDLQYALRFLPHDLLIDTGETVRFNRNVVDVDAQRFADLIAAPSINSIRHATEIYRGNLLEDFTTGVGAFDAWLTERRQNFRRSAIAIFGRLLAEQAKAGWSEEAVETASRLLALDPSQEIVHRTLMRLQLQQGRPDAALRRYEECATILRREFDREPSEETQRVRDEVLATLEQMPAPREVALSPDRPVLILLVEDDLITSALLEGFVHEAGWEVVAVADGADALMELSRHKFDLLVLDINIPTLNGLKVFEIMMKKEIETPALFITGITGSEVEARSLEMGAAGFLRKPIRKEVLLGRIRGILQRTGRAAAERRIQ